MAKEVYIPIDLWFFVGRDLLLKGYINEDTLINATLEEPKLKWLLLNREEWQSYFVESTIIVINPYEHADESKEEIKEIAFALNIDVKETMKNKDNVEKFPDTMVIFKENGFLEYDNVILMSEERTEHKFKETDEQILSHRGRAFFYTVDGYRLSGLIHEFIHIYEKKFGKPIISDIFDTESMLQMEIFLHYLNVHSLDPKDLKLSYIGETNLKKV